MYVFRNHVGRYGHCILPRKGNPMQFKIEAIEGKRFRLTLPDGSTFNAANKEHLIIFLSRWLDANLQEG